MKSLINIGEEGGKKSTGKKGFAGTRRANVCGGILPGAVCPKEERKKKKCPVDARPWFCPNKTQAVCALHQAEKGGGSRGPRQLPMGLSASWEGNNLIKEFVLDRIGKGEGGAKARDEKRGPLAWDSLEKEEGKKTGDWGENLS